MSMGLSNCDYYNKNKPAPATSCQIASVLQWVTIEQDDTSMPQQSVHHTWQEEKNVKKLHVRGDVRESNT